VTTLSTEPTKATRDAEQSRGRLRNLLGGVPGQTLSLVRDVGVLVELVEQRLVLEILDVARQLPNDLPDLVPDRRRGPDHQYRDDHEQEEEDQQRSLAAAHAPAGQPGHHGVEAKREHECESDCQDHLIGDDHQVGGKGDKGCLEHRRA
jgi:hypothetical protein